ncbi:Ribosomal protein L4/L1 family [Fragilaria crotonensis]|nr:Ribosomal protein L4/L1 family [Fragilaria crotonensis]
MMSRTILRSFAALRLSRLIPQPQAPLLGASSFPSRSSTCSGGLRCNISSQSAASRSASASPTITTRVQLPPNLKVDPRSKLGPFFVKLPNVGQQEDDDRRKNATKAKDREALVDAPAADEKYRTATALNDSYDDDDDDEEEFWFEPPTPRFVIPLPERLHVTVIDKTDFSTPVGSIHLSSSVFGLDPIRFDLVQRVIVYQRNKKRGKRFPALTKTISTVSGSGKKMRPQKGGGTSRAGHKRPAHWRGGAKAHGPKGKVQNYETKLNKKTRKLGLLHALSQKLKEGNLMVMNDFKLEAHKTKPLASILTNVGLSGVEGTSAYLVDWADDQDPLVLRNLPLNLAVAAANLPRIKVSTQAKINVYDVVKHEKLVLTLSAIQALEARLGKVAY